MFQSSLFQFLRSQMTFTNMVDFTDKISLGILQDKFHRFSDSRFKGTKCPCLTAKCQNSDIHVKSFDRVEKIQGMYLSYKIWWRGILDFPPYPRNAHVIFLNVKTKCELLIFVFSKFKCQKLYSLFL
jgi:hypothetical protein